MILRFEYNSTTNFSPAVKEHSFLLRNKPFVSNNQHIINFGLEVSGCPRLSEQTDSFGNAIFFGRVNQEHNEFCVLSHGIVETSDNHCVDTPNPVFLYQSPLVVLNNEIKDFALEYRSSSVETTVKKLCEAVNHKITYQSGTTDVLTDSATVFRQQNGVCQDIAHVFIAALRTLKIPARYVAGYVSGLQLSHAWTEVFYNGYWHGYDATENTCELKHYIKIAHGRDASDCPLNRGIFTGTATENNIIEIKVEYD